MAKEFFTKLTRGGIIPFQMRRRQESVGNPPQIEKQVVSPFSEPSFLLSPEERDQHAKRLLTSAETIVKSFPEYQLQAENSGVNEVDIHIDRDKIGIYYAIVYYPEYEIWITKSCDEIDTNPNLYCNQRNRFGDTFAEEIHLKVKRDGILPQEYYPDGTPRRVENKSLVTYLSREIYIPEGPNEIVPKPVMNSTLAVSQTEQFLEELSRTLRIEENTYDEKP